MLQVGGCVRCQPADGEGRHHDGEVGFDRVAFVVVDRPGPEIGLGHPEALLDLPQLVVGAHHVLRSRRLQVGDVALQPGQGTGFGLEVTVDAAWLPPVSWTNRFRFTARLPGDRLLRFDDLLVDPAQGAAGPVGPVLVDLSCIGLVTTLGEVVADGLGWFGDVRGGGDLLVAEADGGRPQWP